MFSETRYAMNGDLRVAYRASPPGARGSWQAEVPQHRPRAAPGNSTAMPRLDRSHPMEGTPLRTRAANHADSGLS